MSVETKQCSICVDAPPYWQCLAVGADECAYVVSLQAALREALDGWETERDQDYKPNSRIIERNDRGESRESIADWRAAQGAVMKIYVRRRHIIKGERRDPTRCPIALAYKEVTGLQALVSGSSINCSGVSFKISEATRKFIAQFDSGEHAKSFAFMMRASATPS